MLNFTRGQIALGIFLLVILVSGYVFSIKHENNVLRKTNTDLIVKVKTQNAMIEKLHADTIAHEAKAKEIVKSAEPVVQELKGKAEVIYKKQPVETDACKSALRIMND